MAKQQKNGKPQYVKTMWLAFGGLWLFHYVHSL